MTTIFAIALGGALGAVSRYGLARLMMAWLGAGVQPMATLLVNVLGCGLMGVAVGLLLASSTHWGEAMRGFLLIGFLGALTTFSAFSQDTFRLIEHSGYGIAFAYVAGSVVLSLGAFFACLYWVRGG